VNLKERLENWKAQGLSCAAIGKKIRRNPSSVYYMMRKYGLMGSPINYKEKPDRREIDEDFSMFEWQVLIGAIASTRCRIVRVSGKYKITFTHHENELKYMVWKAKLLNDLKMIGTCKYIRRYTKNKQLTLEYSSALYGPTLMKLKQNKKFPCFHDISKALAFKDRKRKIDNEDESIQKYLDEIEAVEVPEPEIIGKCECWSVFDK
jgi:hypothetical protein